MIPKIIWQTYEQDYDSLSEEIKELTESWKKLNPEYEYRYMSSSDREKFVLENYGKEWFNIFINLPFNVMRANVWRYMVINTYGGVYVDIDTICKKPISYWIKNDHDMTITIEHPQEISFCQFIFASKNNNLILINLLNSIKEKLSRNSHYNSNTDFVAETTGYLIWDHEIKDRKYMESVNIYAYVGEETKKIILESIQHLRGSINTFNGYEAWRKKWWENNE
jgi:mannosyltransferase OCH1-like enzyme